MADLGKHHLSHALLQDSLNPLPLATGGKDIGLDGSPLWLNTAAARNSPSSAIFCLKINLGEE